MLNGGSMVWGFCVYFVYMIPLETDVLRKHRFQKSLETVFLIAICRPSGDKWQAKTLFLMIFYLRLSIVLTFSIAAYPV